MSCMLSTVAVVKNLKCMPSLTMKLNSNKVDSQASGYHLMHQGTAVLPWFSGQVTLEEENV